jgi:hypothetical protein
MFRRAQALTGDEDLGAAADYWLQLTRDYRQHPTDSGFAFGSTAKTEDRVFPAGFLMGAAGAALAIAAELGGDARWERLLVIDHGGDAEPLH